MTDKEMIEGMAKVIHFNYWGTCAKDSCSDCPHNVHNICKDKIIAERLYNKLFPEDSIVLSREKYDTLKAENDKYVKDCINYLATINKLENRVWQAELESKETARDIFAKEREFIYSKWKSSITMNDLIEIAKQFGVEVEE